MHLALVPGLLIALALGIWSGSPAEAAGVLPLPEQDRLASLNYTSQVSGYKFRVTDQSSTYSDLQPSTFNLQPAAQVTGTAETAATSAITSTATVTATAAPLTTPIPLPTAAPQTTMRWNPFDWAFLTEIPQPPLGPLAWTYTALMLGLIGAGVYFYFVKRNEWKRTNSVLKRAADRWAPVAIWVGIVLLVFALFRFGQLPFLGVRVWYYSHLLALLAVAGWFYYWYRNTYPKQLAKYQKAQRMRQYMPGTARKGGAKPAPAPQRTGAGSASPATATTTPIEGSPTGAEATPGAAQSSQSAQQNRKRRRK